MFRWINAFQLFLFDFDGLLVNTEHLHYQAYINMLRIHGYDLDWSFGAFCEKAHLNAEALKEALYAKFPDLDRNWDLLYKEKKEHYLELISSGKVALMPGVEPLLQALEEAKIRRCVVTNSPLEQIALIRSKIKALQTIPKWITRENYLSPKPHPESYLRAIELYGEKGDKIIGFEDSLRGIEALKNTPALPVLICPSHHPLLEMATEGGVLHFPSFTDISEEGLKSRSAF